MSQQTETRLIDAGIIAGTPDAPVLVGSRCRRCGVVAFPRQATCAACTSGEVEEHTLARRGALWTWTIQCFRPKSPPYADEAEDFEPYGVGYVELPGEVVENTRAKYVEAYERLVGRPFETWLGLAGA